MDNFWLLLVSFTLLAALVFFTKIKSQKCHKQSHPPPGPKPWPIIGSLHLVSNISPHLSFHELSRKYGGIMQIQFGSKPFVIASSPEMAKEFLQTHDCTFASRPLTAAGKYISYNNSDVTFAPYGSYWRLGRKIYLSELLNAKRLGSYEHIRIEERRSLISRLYALSVKPVVVRDHLYRFTLSAITRTVLGKTYFSIDESKDDKSIITFEELRDILDRWFVLNGVINIGDVIPWLNVFDLQGYIKQMKELQEDFNNFLNFVMGDHEAKMKAEKDFVPKDMVAILLKLAEDPNLEVKLTRDCVKGLILDLLLGGTDTSATTVEWAITALVKQPHLIKKATEELDRVVGKDRWVEEDDFSKLPFLDAIIKETFRLYPLCTILAPRYATEDCKVAGYDISKGTTVLINAWSTGKDPNHWDSPEEFLPERFLGKEIDLMGQNFGLLAFGSGRRRCAGYALGLKAVKSMLANILHGFNLKLPDEMKPEDVCMEEVYGFTTHPKVPIALYFEPRLAIHLYN